MSTRAQVACVQNKTPIYLYQHCDGYDVPKEVQNAFKSAPDRWSDPSYLNRVIFSHMIMGGTYTSPSTGKVVNALDQTTGYGIGLLPCENQYNLIIVDHDNMRIGFDDAQQYNPDKYFLVEYVTWYTYKEYIALSDKELEVAYGMHG